MFSQFDHNFFLLGMQAKQQLEDVSNKPCIKKNLMSKQGQKIIDGRQKKTCPPLLSLPPPTKKIRQMFEWSQKEIVKILKHNTVLYYKRSGRRDECNDDNKCRRCYWCCFSRLSFFLPLDHVGDGDVVGKVGGTVELKVESFLETTLL